MMLNKDKLNLRIQIMQGCVYVPHTPDFGNSTIIDSLMASVILKTVNEVK